MADSMSEWIVLTVFNKKLKAPSCRMGCRQFGRIDLIQINAKVAGAVSEALFPAFAGFNYVVRE